MGLREWPVGRIVLLSTVWIFATLGFFVVTMLREAGRSGGVGAVSLGVGEVLALAAGPPLLLILAWQVLRRRSVSGK